MVFDVNGTVVVWRRGIIGTVLAATAPLNLQLREVLSYGGMQS
jgi:hypothetical protein